MSTTYETDSNTQTVSAGYDIEPHTQTVQTVATAWASSPLGQLEYPEYEVGSGFAPEPVSDSEDRRPVAKHAVVALALAGGIGAGAALGLMFVDFTPAPRAVEPGVSSPGHAVVVTETGQETAPAIATAPANAPSLPDVGTPPAGTAGGTTVVEIPLPDNPPPSGKPNVNEPEQPQPDVNEPQQPKPEDPDPVPPLDNDDLTLPDPIPDPVPPLDNDDLTLPDPIPDPDPVPPLLSDDLTLPDPIPDPDPVPPVFVPDLPVKLGS
jgi:hypothetical protein